MLRQELKINRGIMFLLQWLTLKPQLAVKGKLLMNTPDACLLHYMLSSTVVITPKSKLHILWIEEARYSTRTCKNDQFPWCWITIQFGIGHFILLFANPGRPHPLLFSPQFRLFTVAHDVNSYFDECRYLPSGLLVIRPRPLAAWTFLGETRRLTGRRGRK